VDPASLDVGKDSLGCGCVVDVWLWGSPVLRGRSAGEAGSGQFFFRLFAGNLSHFLRDAVSLFAAPVQVRGPE
jgi:hypothetical protein